MKEIKDHKVWCLANSFHGSKPCNCGAAPSGSEFALPTVAGRRLRGSNADFERACLVHIARLQNGIGDYDSAMSDTFCEAVRLCREYSDVMAMQNSEVSHAR